MLNLLGGGQSNIDAAQIENQLSAINSKLDTLAQDQYQDCEAILSALSDIKVQNEINAYNAAATAMSTPVSYIVSYQQDYNGIVADLQQNGGHVNELDSIDKQDMVDMLSGDPTKGLRPIMNTIAGLEGGTQVGSKNMIDLYNQVLIDEAGYDPFQTHIFTAAFVDAAFAQADYYGSMIDQAAYLYANMAHLSFTLDDNTYAPNPDGIVQFVNIAQTDIHQWYVDFSDGPTGDGPANWVSQTAKQSLAPIPTDTVLDYRVQSHPMLWTDSPVVLDGDPNQPDPLLLRQHRAVLLRRHLRQRRRATTSRSGPGAGLHPPGVAVGPARRHPDRGCRPRRLERLAGADHHRLRLPPGRLHRRAVQLGAGQPPRHAHTTSRARPVRGHGAHRAGVILPIAGRHRYHRQVPAPLRVAHRHRPDREQPHPGAALPGPVGRRRRGRPIVPGARLPDRPPRPPRSAPKRWATPTRSPPNPMRRPSRPRRLRRHPAPPSPPAGHSPTVAADLAPTTFSTPATCEADTIDPTYYTVPDGAAAVTITAAGAAGAPGTTDGKVTSTGGLAGTVTETVPVTPGETLYVGVGGVGGGHTDQTGGVGGGGTGGRTDSIETGDAAGGGGGASGVSTTPYCTHWLVVAGGGGGGGSGVKLGIGKSPTSGGNGGNGCATRRQLHRRHRRSKQPRRPGPGRRSRPFEQWRRRRDLRGCVGSQWQQRDLPWPAVTAATAPAAATRAAAVAAAAAATTAAAVAAAAASTLGGGGGGRRGQLGHPRRQRHQLRPGHRRPERVGHHHPAPQDHAARRLLGQHRSQLDHRGVGPAGRPDRHPAR